MTDKIDVSKGRYWDRAWSLKGRKKMKTLSIKQPWAWAIIHGGKPLENRRWYTSYRGPLAIHASKTFDHEGYQWIAENENRLGIVLPQKHEFKLGGIVGRVDLVDCVGHHGSLWFFGPYGFVMANPAPLPFLPCRGQLGIFEIKFGW